MIPLKDYNPTRRVAVVTALLIAANLGVYFLIQRPYERGLGDATFTFQYAAIPCEVVEGRPLTVDEVGRTTDGNDAYACTTPSSRRLLRIPGLGDVPADAPLFPRKQVYLAVLYSMFLHGSILHIAGNMLFLWVFGNNIEERMGTLGYVVFYLGSGLAAAAAHILVQPYSSVPVVGASGAIAGVMGAYLVLFPNVQIRSLIIFFFVLFRDIPAKWLLGLWFVSQFFVNPNQGVAWVAHVGGFVFGALVAFLLRDRLRPQAEPARPLWY